MMIRIVDRRPASFYGRPRLLAGDFAAVTMAVVMAAVVTSAAVGRNRANLWMIDHRWSRMETTKSPPTFERQTVVRRSRLTAVARAGTAELRITVAPQRFPALAKLCRARHLMTSPTMEVMTSHVQSMSCRAESKTSREKWMTSQQRVI